MSELICISGIFSVYWIPLTPSTEIYYRVPSTVPFPIFQNITRYVHCWPPRPHGQPPILQHKDPQRAPRLSTRFTDHSCLHRHDRVALFIHRWGWGHTSDPLPCITLPPNRTAGCLKLSTGNTWTDCQHMCVCLVQGRSFSFLDLI